MTQDQDAADNVEIWRIKGVVAVEGSPFKHSVQATHSTWTCKPTDIEWKESELRQCNIIFIGRNLPPTLSSVFALSK